MKTTNQEKVIVTLTIIILTIATILYSVQPDSTAGAVQYTAGTTAQQAHVTSESVTWTDAYHYAPKNAPALIGDCLADRVTGDLYPQPDPYCLPVPSVAVAETVKRNDTDTPVIVDVPATPETEEPPVVEPPVVTPPTEEPETPEQPEQPTEDKNKCNKGSGNGSEGCDPGNHPENGNNDEGGDRHPENSNRGGNNH